MRLQILSRLALLAAVYLAGFCPALLAVAKAADTTPPTITCPPAVTVQCDADVPAPDFSGGTATDDMDPKPVVAHLGDSAVGSCPKTITRTYQATDAAGNMASCMQRIIVNDTTPPTITCAPNFTVECGLPFSFNVPTVSDNCAAALTVVETTTNYTCGNAFIAARVWQATDLCGNSTLCTQVVSVVNTRGPTALCLPNTTIRTTNSGGAVLNFPPTAAEGCGPLITFYCDPPADSTFPISTTPVTCTAIDACFNRDTCSFLVTVICDGGPQIVCPPDSTVACASPVGVVAEYTPTIIPSQCASVASVNCLPPSGSVLLPGVHQICCTLIDSRRVTNRCCFRITALADTNPPSITQCPMSLLATAPNCQPVAVAYNLPVAQDNCALDRLFCTPPSPGPFPVGTTTVRCGAVDKSGNSNGCSFTVTVTCASNECVRLVCPNDSLINCATNNQRVSYLAYATNACSGTTNGLICRPTSGSVFPIGTTNVCCTNSFQGVTNFCCFRVTLSSADTTAPAIACSTNVIVTSTNCRPLAVSYAAPVASDNCTLDRVTCTPTNGATFQVGITAVTCCAFDHIGNSTCCTFTVTVRCPQICVRMICPNDITNNCATNGQPVNYTNAVATNTCAGGTLDVVCTPPSGTAFALGTNIVCCTNVFTGFTNTCCFRIVLSSDAGPPSIVCSTNRVVPSPNCTPMAVQYAAPSNSDNCLVDQLVCTPVSGSTFPTGVTTVECCAFDAAGNRACCTFTVDVRCPPPNCVRMVCPDYLPLACGSSTGQVVNFGAYATNPCTRATLPVVCSPTNGSRFPLGTSAVCCTNVFTNDFFGSATVYTSFCCFEVTVTRDLVPPTIVCPSNVVVISPNCTPFAALFALPPAADDCAVDHVTCTPAPGSTFPLGVTTVTCCAFDRAGNSTCCTFPLIVRCPPTNCVRVLCPADVTVNCAINGQAIDYPAAIATNFCSGGTLPVICSPPAGTPFPAGTNTVCCTNVFEGFTNSCCFRVIVVRDTTVPVISCPPNQVLTVPTCTPGAVSYTLPSATDNCQLDSVRCTPAPGSLFQIGRTVVSCCALDRASNSACCTFTITVQCPSNECPRVICPADFTVNCGATNGQIVSYTAYATNLCAGTALPVVCVPPSGSTFPLGARTVCCTNVFGGFTNFCCFQVTVVRDMVPPDISCPTNRDVVSANCTAIPVQYASATATDNCALDRVTCIPASGATFLVGTTTVTCCAFDRATNVACCTFTVTVRCPATNCVQVLCPSNITVNCAAPNGRFVSYTANGTNFCTRTTFPVACVPPSGSLFPLGTRSVCCTNVTDGFTNFCCFQVTVNADTTPPVINCPTNMVVFCSPSNGTKVTWTVEATDLCAQAATAVACVPASGSVFPLGCTNVVCTATDLAGNTNACTFRVCVLAMGCYLKNPSFELLVANPQAPNNCNNLVSLAQDWSILAGSPKLFRPPYSTIATGNCQGMENPCEGTNYAMIQGGYNLSNQRFSTDQMMGSLVAPLANGQTFRLRACLSLAENSTNPVPIEFVLASSANTNQQVLYQTSVTQTNGWIQYQPPCFTVPTNGVWDRLIIRAAQVTGATPQYQTGFVYIDNVNICCCTPLLLTPTISGNDVVLTWNAFGELQAAASITNPMVWQPVNAPVSFDPLTGRYSARVPRTSPQRFFRIVSSDATVPCIPCLLP